MWTQNAVKEGVEVTRTIIKGKKDANMTLEYGGEKGGGVVGEKRGRGVGTGARDRKRARLGQ